MLREHVSRHPKLQTAAHTNSPGSSPATCQACHCIRTTSAVFCPATASHRPAARGATWRDIVHDAPPAVLAQMLGLPLPPPNATPRSLALTTAATPPVGNRARQRHSCAIDATWSGLKLVWR